jgi:hypothetical protein
LHFDPLNIIPNWRLPKPGHVMVEISSSHVRNLLIFLPNSIALKTHQEAMLKRGTQPYEPNNILMTKRTNSHLESTLKAYSSIIDAEFAAAQPEFLEFFLFGS